MKLSENRFGKTVSRVSRLKTVIERVSVLNGEFLDYINIS